jgi:hypothetical protein
MMDVGIFSNHVIQLAILGDVDDGDARRRLYM